MLELLYTPTAMVIAKSVLVTPIVAALTRQVIADLYDEYREQLRSLGLGLWDVIDTLLWDARYSLLTVALAGFGRAIAEVGAVIIVGGLSTTFARDDHNHRARDLERESRARPGARYGADGAGAGRQLGRDGRSWHGDAHSACSSAP